MKKSVSIVEARRELGRLAEEVRRTGQPVTLTRRGRAVARIAPEPVPKTAPGRSRDAFAELRGSVELRCSFGELQRAVRELRAELTRSLESRATVLPPSRGRRRG